VTYTCPASLTAAPVPNKSGVWTYTGNVVGGTNPALTIGQWTQADLPTVRAFSQARFATQGRKGTPVLNCWYSDGTSPYAVNGAADLPSKNCTPTTNCQNTDPTQCPVTCSE